MGFQGIEPGLAMFTAIIILSVLMLQLQLCLQFFPKRGRDEASGTGSTLLARNGNLRLSESSIRTENRCPAKGAFASLAKWLFIVQTLGGETEHICPSGRNLALPRQEVRSEPGHSGAGLWTDR